MTVDAFFDPYRTTFSQFNTDFRVQQSNDWYIDVGQRYSRDGNRVRRGDIRLEVGLRRNRGPPRDGLGCDPGPGPADPGVLGQRQLHPPSAQERTPRQRPARSGAR